MSKMRTTLFKVCYWNELTDREICIFKTSDYGEAEKECYTRDCHADELYIKKVAVKPKHPPTLEMSREEK